MELTERASVVEAVFCPLEEVVVAGVPPSCAPAERPRLAEEPPRPPCRLDAVTADTVAALAPTRDRLRRTRPPLIVTVDEAMEPDLPREWRELQGRKMSSPARPRRGGRKTGGSWRRGSLVLPEEAVLRILGRARLRELGGVETVI